MPVGMSDMELAVTYRIIDEGSPVLKNSTNRIKEFGSEIKKNSRGMEDGKKAASGFNNSMWSAGTSTDRLNKLLSSQYAYKMFTYNMLRMSGSMNPVVNMLSRLTMMVGGVGPATLIGGMAALGAVFSIVSSQASAANISIAGMMDQARSSGMSFESFMKSTTGATINPNISAEAEISAVAEQRRKDRDAANKAQMAAAFGQGMRGLNMFTPPWAESDALDNTGPTAKGLQEYTKFASIVDAMDKKGLESKRAILDIEYKDKKAAYDSMIVMGDASIGLRLELDRWYAKSKSELDKQGTAQFIDLNRERFQLEEDYTKRIEAEYYLRLIAAEQYQGEDYKLAVANAEKKKKLDTTKEQIVRQQQYLQVIQTGWSGVTDVLEQAVGQNKEYAGLMKAMRIGEAIINTAVAVTSALATTQPAYLAPAMATMIGVLGAAQVGIIAAQPMAEGGIVTRPTHALIGESGPEAVIPLDKFSGGGDTYISIYAIDTQSFAEALRKNPEAITSIVQDNVKNNRSLRRTIRDGR